MNSNNKNNQKCNKCNCQNKCNKCNYNNTGNCNDIAYSIYFIFHITLSLIAFYLSWKCNNNNFDLYSFISALLFPYFYIIYILSTRGTCGIISSEKL